jgi:hypothetical protein
MPGRTPEETLEMQIMQVLGKARETQERLQADILVCPTLRLLWLSLVPEVLC